MQCLQCAFDRELSLLCFLVKFCNFFHLAMSLNNLNKFGSSSCRYVGCVHYQESQGFWNCFHYRGRETRQSQVNKEFFTSTSGQGFTNRIPCPPPILGTRLTESWRHSVLYASLITAYKAWCLKSYIIKRRFRLLQALSVSVRIPLC
jgi:hypothetical protein